MRKFWQYLAKRLATIVFTIFSISIFVFGITNVLPGNVATMILGQYSSEEKVAALETRLGLNEPLHVQYIDWLSGILTGDWGMSLIYNKPIPELLVPRLIHSLQLALVTMVIITVIGISLGVLAGVKHNKRTDSIISTGVYLGVSFPEFVIGAFLILLLGGPFFSVFPSGGYAPLSEGVVKWFSYMALPAATLSITLLAHVVRQTRSEMVEALQSDYVNAARLKGLSEWRVIGKHALRNSLLPTITLLALDLGWLMGGLVVIEELFSFPGIGRLVVEAIRNRDLPVIQITVLLIAAVYTVGNLVADLVYTYLDPRIGFE